MAETPDNRREGPEANKDPREGLEDFLTKISEGLKHPEDKDVFLEKFEKDKRLAAVLEPAFLPAVEELGHRLAQGEPLDDRGQALLFAYVSFYGEKGGAITRIREILDPAVRKAEGAVSGEKPEWANGTVGRDEEPDPEADLARREAAEDKAFFEAKERRERSLPLDVHIRSRSGLIALDAIAGMWARAAEGQAADALFKGLRDAPGRLEAEAEAARAAASRALEASVARSTEGRRTLPEDVGEARKSFLAAAEAGEGEMSVLGKEGLAKIAEVLAKGGDPDEAVLLTATLLREAGKSSAVRPELADLLVRSSPEMAPLRKMIDDGRALAAMTSGKGEDFVALGADKEDAPAVAEFARHMREQHFAARAEVEKEVHKRYPDADAARVSAIATDALENSWADTAPKAFQESVLKGWIRSYPYVRSQADLRGRACELYGGIVGASEGEMSDARKAYWKEMGINLAIALVPLAGEALVAKLAVSGAAAAFAGSRTALAVERMAQAGTVGKIAAGGLELGGKSLAGGLAFHATKSVLDTVLYRKHLSEIGSALADPKEAAKSVAFFAVLGGVERAMGTAAGKAFSTGFEKAVPQEFLRSFDRVATEAGLVAGTGTAVEFVFEGKGDLTLEQYIQAFVIVGTFRATPAMIGKSLEVAEGVSLRIKAATDRRETVGADPSRRETEGAETARAENGKAETKGEAQPEAKPEGKDALKASEKLTDAQQEARILRGLKILPKLVGDIPHALISSSALWIRGVKGVGLPGDVDIAMDGNRVNPQTFASDFLANVAKVNAGAEKGMEPIRNIRFVELRPKSEGDPVIHDATTTKGLANITKAIETGRLDLKFDYRDNPTQAKGLEMELFPERGGLGLTNLAETGKAVETVPLEIDGRAFDAKTLSLSAASEGYVMNFLAEFYANTVRSIRRAPEKDGHPDIKVKEAQRLWSMSLALTEAGLIKSPADLVSFFAATIAKYEAMPNKGNYVSDALANKNAALEGLKEAVSMFKDFKRELRAKEGEKEGDSLPDFKDFEEKLFYGKVKLSRAYVEFMFSGAKPEKEGQVLAELETMARFLKDIQGQIRGDADFAYFYEVSTTRARFIKRTTADIEKAKLFFSRH